MSAGAFFAIWALGWLITLRAWIGHAERIEMISLDELDGEDLMFGVLLPAFVGLIVWPMALVVLWGMSSARYVAESPLGPAAKKAALWAFTPDREMRKARMAGRRPMVERDMDRYRY